MALSTNIQNAFKTTLKIKLEEGSFKLLINAYELTLSEKKYQLDWDEDDFNEQICENIRRDRTCITLGIIVETEHKLFSSVKIKSKGFADKLPRIDFAFHDWGKLDYKYYMEAKRLKEKDSKLKRAYIKEGMERFISQKYPLGSMIGYLVEGDEQKTIEGINKLLTNDKRELEKLVSKIHPIHNSYYESDNHATIGLLKHIILDFT